MTNKGSMIQGDSTLTHVKDTRIHLGSLTWVTMTNKGSMIQGDSTLTHVKDPRCILVRDIQTDKVRGSFLIGTNIQTQGSLLTNIVIGVQLPQANKGTLVIPIQIRT